MALGHIGVGPDEPILLLAPGSRPSEIARVLPVFEEAVARLKADRPGLEVAPCRTPAEVELFERTSVEAFTGGTAGWSPGTIHPPEASLRVPGLTLLLARLNGRPVGTAIAATDGTVLNVGGVAVLEAARGQGVGAHLTLACLATAPPLPAVLSSSQDGHALYRILGFADAGPTAIWWRPGPRAS